MRAAASLVLLAAVLPGVAALQAGTFLLSDCASGAAVIPVSTDSEVSVLPYRGVDVVAEGRALLTRDAPWNFARLADTAAFFWDRTLLLWGDVAVSFGAFRPVLQAGSNVVTYELVKDFGHTDKLAVRVTGSRVEAERLPRWNPVDTAAWLAKKSVDPFGLWDRLFARGKQLLLGALQPILPASLVAAEAGKDAVALAHLSPFTPEAYVSVHLDAPTRKALEAYTARLGASMGSSSTGKSSSTTSAKRGSKPAGELLVGFSCTAKRVAFSRLLLVAAGTALYSAANYLSMTAAFYYAGGASIAIAAFMVVVVYVLYRQRRSKVLWGTTAVTGFGGLWLKAWDGARDALAARGGAADSAAAQAAAAAAAAEAAAGYHDYEDTALLVFGGISAALAVAVVMWMYVKGGVADSPRLHKAIGFIMKAAALFMIYSSFSWRPVGVFVAAAVLAREAAAGPAGWVLDKLESYPRVVALPGAKALIMATRLVFCAWRRKGEAGGEGLQDPSAAGEADAAAAAAWAAAGGARPSLGGMPANVLFGPDGQAWVAAGSLDPRLSMGGAGFGRPSTAAEQLMRQSMGGYAAGLGGRASYVPAIVGRDGRLSYMSVEQAGGFGVHHGGYGRLSEAPLAGGRGSVGGGQRPSLPVAPPPAEAPAPAAARSSFGWFGDVLRGRRSSAPVVPSAPPEEAPVMPSAPPAHTPSNQGVRPLAPHEVPSGWGGVSPSMVAAARRGTSAGSVGGFGLDAAATGAAAAPAPRLAPLPEASPAGSRRSGGGHSSSASVPVRAPGEDMVDEDPAPVSEDEEEEEEAPRRRTGKAAGGKAFDASQRLAGKKRRRQEESEEEEEDQYEDDLNGRAPADDSEDEEEERRRRRSGKGKARKGGKAKRRRYDSEDDEEDEDEEEEVEDVRPRKKARKEAKSSSNSNSGGGGAGGSDDEDDEEEEGAPVRRGSKKAPGKASKKADKRAPARVVALSSEDEEDDAEDEDEEGDDDSAPAAAASTLRRRR